METLQLIINEKEGDHYLNWIKNRDRDREREREWPRDKEREREWTRDKERESDLEIKRESNSKGVKEILSVKCDKISEYEYLIVD